MSTTFFYICSGKSVIDCSESVVALDFYAKVFQEFYALVLALCYHFTTLFNWDMPKEWNFLSLTVVSYIANIASEQKFHPHIMYK